MDQPTKSSSSLFFHHTQPINDPTVLAKINKIRSKLLELPEINVNELNNMSKNKEVFHQDIDMTKFSLQYFQNYVKILCCIIGADGEVSEAEFNTMLQNLTQFLGGQLQSNPIFQQYAVQFKSYVQHKLFLQEDIKQLAESVNSEIKQLGLVGNIGLGLIYQAITAARADGEFNQQEKDAVKNIAKILNIKESDLELIQKLARVETRLKGIQTSSLNVLAGGKEPTALDELDELYNKTIAANVNIPTLSK